MSCFISLRLGLWHRVTFYWCWFAVVRVAVPVFVWGDTRTAPETGRVGIVKVKVKVMSRKREGLMIEKGRIEMMIQALCHSLIKIRGISMMMLTHLMPTHQELEVLICPVPILVLHLYWITEQSCNSTLHLTPQDTKFIVLDQFPIHVLHSCNETWIVVYSYPNTQIPQFWVPALVITISIPIPLKLIPMIPIQYQLGGKAKPIIIVYLVTDHQNSISLKAQKGTPSLRFKSLMFIIL